MRDKQLLIAEVVYEHIIEQLERGLHESNVGGE